MWYYVSNGQQAGPISQEELQQKLQGDLPPSTLVWKEGMAEWVKAHTLTEFPFTNSASSPPSLPQSNPYSAPSSICEPSYDSSHSYAFPSVKKASFPLLMSLLIIGLLGIIGGYVMLFTGIAASTPQEPLDNYNFEHFQSNEESAQNTSSQTSPSQLSSVFSASLLVVFGGYIILFSGFIVGCIYVYRAWKIIQPAGASHTPGQAVGFLFIPLFNLYWIFIAYRQWALEWNATTSRHSTLVHAPKGAEGVFLGMAICYCSSFITSILGLAAAGILYLIGMKSMCDVINYAAEKNAESSLT